MDIQITVLKFEAKVLSIWGYNHWDTPPLLLGGYLFIYNTEILDTIWQLDPMFDDMFVDSVKVVRTFLSNVLAFPSV